LNPQHPLVPPKIVSSTHLFLDLEKLQPELSAWIEKAKVKGEWSENAIQITNGQLNNGLKSRPITKDLRWGTPVPKPGFEEKVFYVWSVPCPCTLLAMHQIDGT
jgi:methionyl-tRNA synthetase